MKKKTKILWGALAALIVILLVALIIIANYFFDFALVPSSGTGLVIEASDSTGDDSKREDLQWLDETSEDVYIVSNDGLKLHGYYGMNPAGDSHKYVLLIHGYMGRGTDMTYFARHYYDRGWNYLIIDHRAHGQSEGKYIGMGWLERLDMLDWIDLISSKDSQAEIALHGISMGGATVMMTTGEDLPANVKVAVEDCGYTSVYDEFANQLKEMFGLPPFPIIPVASLVTDIRAGYTFKEASSVKQVEKSITPTLFIHGADDTFVDFAMLDVVYEAAACEKEKLVVEGAGHGQSFDVAPELYWSTIDRFIDRYIPAQPEN